MDKETAMALNSWLNDIFCLINKGDRTVISVISKGYETGSGSEYDVHLIDTVAEIARVTISECEILTENELTGI